MKEETTTRRRRDAEETESGDFQIVDGELLEVSTGDALDTPDEERSLITAKNKTLKTKNQKAKTPNQTANQKIYLLLPLLFLTVALLGGLRFAAPTNDFLFLKPALVSLVFGAILLVLFFRAQLIKLDGWFSEDFSGLKNIANAFVLIALFAASAQVFNALLPERGLPFWTVAFCFFWTLWNNLFAEFDTRKLLRSLGALFGLAFVVKYLVLANLAAPTSASWWQGIWQNPAQETFTWLLDLPRFSAATGYVQFFTLVFYLIGLFLLPNSTVASFKQLERR